MRFALFALLLLGLFAVAATGCRPSTDMTQLEAELLSATEGFEGRVGLYVRHLESGREIAINADSLFPTASMIKVPIMLKTFDLIESGDLDYHAVQVYRDSLFYSGDDLAGSLRDSAEVQLSKLILLMMSISDNTASLWLQQLAGTGTAINDWLAENGYQGTRVNSRTDGRRTDWERYGWGQTTPREMADLVVMIRDGRAISTSASEEMYRAMTRSFWNDEALSELPPWVQAAAKNGAVSDSRSEVVLVNAPSGDYVFCVITDGQVDRSWEDDNAGFVLIRNISKILWRTFEPTRSEWRG